MQLAPGQIHPIVAARELGRTLPRGRGSLSRYAATQGASTRDGLHNFPAAQQDSTFEPSQADLPTLQGRCFQLHLDQGDVRGHNMGRTGRCVGSGVQFKCTPRPEEIGLSAEVTAVTARQIDRKRYLHSSAGGLDASGRGRSEGLLQACAFLTHVIFGGCLIHRLWRPAANRILPLAIELIPSVRISQPFNMYGSRLVHNGVAYSDEHRSHVVGYHVRRVPETIGNATVARPEWDFVSVEDATLLELMEPAGVDRAFPNAIAAIKLLFNRGQMFEAVIEAARNHASTYAVMQVAEGHNPLDRAEDVADALPEGYRNVDGVKERYIYAGDKYEYKSAVMPGPDFRGVMDACDERLARALNTRLSEFTRAMDASYSGGMQERQIDKPNVDIMRENFVDAWRTVYGWSLDACFLSGAVPMPGYGAATKVFWLDARIRFPGEPPLNPVDHRNAQNMAIATGLESEIGACESDGFDYEDIQRERAHAWKIRRKIEKEFESDGMEPGTLDPLKELPKVQKATQIDADHDGKTNEKQREEEHLPGYGAGTRGSFRNRHAEARSARYVAAGKVQRYFAGRIGDTAKVDFDKRVIYNVAIATIGPALGHNSVLVDAETLEQIAALGAKMPTRSRMDHPESKAGDEDRVEISGKLEDVVGTFENFRVEGNKVVADFYAVPAAAPAGGRSTGLLHMANDPRVAKTFGVSMICAQWIKENKIRVGDLFSIDWVDVPALNPTGVFSGENPMADEKKPPFTVSKENGKYRIKFEADANCKAGDSYDIGDAPEEKKEEKKTEANAATAGDEAATQKDLTKNAAAIAGAKTYTAAEVEAARLDGELKAKNYAVEFDGACDSAGIKGDARDAFRKDMYGIDIKAVKACATQIAAARTTALGSGGTGADKGLTEEEQAAVQRFNDNTDLRRNWFEVKDVAKIDVPDSPEYKGALNKFILQRRESAKGVAKKA